MWDGEGSIMKLLPISNIVSTALVFVLNIMASMGLINNRTTGQLSDKLPNLFVPSGITFSIWSLIYTLLFLFVIRQAEGLLSKDSGGSMYLRKIGWFFVLSNIANSVWIFAWHYELVPVSLIFMVLLFVSLLAIYLRLGIGRSDTVMSRREKLFFNTPFSVYLGWITVAAIANVTAVLVWARVRPYTQTTVIWTILVIIVAAVIGILMLWTRKDIAYGLVIIWALIGIVMKRLDPGYFRELTVATTAGITALIVSMAVIVTLIHTRTISPSTR
jgi:hypothetical protein